MILSTYKLERPQGSVGYDENRAMVLVAVSPAAARKLAASNAGPEGRAVWLDQLQSTITNESRVNTSRVLLVDFNAG